MTIRFANPLFYVLTVGSIILVGAIQVQGQGTITFDAHPLWSGTNYSESGMGFHVITAQGATYYDSMGIVPPNWAQNVPQNSTPYMLFFRENNDYVVLGLVNGSAFGLTSVQLADPNSPSLSPVAISFVGYLAGGSTITNTFTTPGSGADHLLSYQFTSDFASGLMSVDIQAPRWAMDNLAFTVPEPNTAALVLLALLVSALRMRGARAARVGSTQSGKP